MDWPYVVMILAGLVLLLGVLMLVRAGPEEPAAVADSPAAEPVQRQPRTPYMRADPQPRQPAGVWEIAQGVFWGLWMFVVSAAVLGAAWFVFVIWAWGATGTLARQLGTLDHESYRATRRVGGSGTCVLSTGDAIESPWRSVPAPDL